MSLDKATTAELTSRLYEIKPEHSAADWKKTRLAYEQVLEDVLGIARLRRLNHGVGVQCLSPEVVDIKFVGTNNTEASATMKLSPNPASDYTRINYEVGQDADITIMLRDDIGSNLGTLVNAFHKKGAYEYMLSTDKLQSNLYLVVMRAGKTLVSKKLIIQK